MYCIEYIFGVSGHQLISQGSYFLHRISGVSMMLEDFSVSIRPAEPLRLTGPEEEHDAEHGEDGGHHHPEEGVQLSGILLGGPGAGGARLRGLLP